MYVGGRKAGTTPGLRSAAGFRSATSPSVETFRYTPALCSGAAFRSAAVFFSLALTTRLASQIARSARLRLVSLSASRFAPALRSAVAFCSPSGLGLVAVLCWAAVCHATRSSFCVCFLLVGGLQHG